MLAAPLRSLNASQNPRTLTILRYSRVKTPCTGPRRPKPQDGVRRDTTSYKYTYSHKCRHTQGILILLVASRTTSAKNDTRYIDYGRHEHQNLLCELLKYSTFQERALTVGIGFRVFSYYIYFQQGASRRAITSYHYPYCIQEPGTCTIFPLSG